VRAPSEMDVNMAWTDKERNKEQVEDETYPSIQKRESDPKNRDYRPNNNSPLGETYDVRVKILFDKTILARRVPSYRVERQPCRSQVRTINPDSRR
jgi:hypothetical protein